MEAPTLMIDTGQRNQVRIEGLSQNQVQALTDASPDLRQAAVGSGTREELRTLGVDGIGRLILTKGGFWTQTPVD